MAGKYYSGAGSASGVLESRGCGGLGAGYVNDTVGAGCWAVVGERVLIQDTAHSVQAGFEVCNFNFRVDSTAPPIPNRVQLPGPFYGAT